MGNDVLVFWAILHVAVGAEVFLPYVEPSNRGRFLCCLERLYRLVTDDPWFGGFMGFPRCSQHSLTLPTNHFMHSGTLAMVLACFTA